MMSLLKIISFVLLVGLGSCKQRSTVIKVDPKAVELNNTAMKLVNFLNNPDSSKKAILLLDEATKIDTNYFLGYYNKLMFYSQLKQYDKAIITINKLIQIRPYAHDLYLTGGILYEGIGDTVSSKQYFTKSLIICSNVLDTMSIKNRDYEMLVTNKATNLIMLGDQEKANQLLKKLYEGQSDEEIKNEILSMMNKNKKELLQHLFR